MLSLVTYADIDSHNKALIKAKETGGSHRSWLFFPPASDDVVTGDPALATLAEDHWTLVRQRTITSGCISGAYWRPGENPR